MMDFSWITDNLGDLGSAALGAYGVYSQNQAANKYYDTLDQIDSDKQSLATAKAEYEARVSALMGGGGGGGGGGGASRKYVTPEMLNIYKDYMGKAQGLYQPWVDAGTSLLPKASSAYGTGLGVAEQLAKAYSTPEMLQQMNMSVPAYNIGFKIPGVK